MDKIVIFLLCITCISIAKYDCEDCRNDIAQCKEWADNAAKQGRIPKYCDESRCDHLCEEEYKKNNGIKTDAEKYADQRFNSEMGFINSTAAYINSLSNEQGEIYDYVMRYIDGMYSTAYNYCYQKNAHLMGYGMNDDFTIKLCVVEQLRGITYKINQQEFFKIMTKLNIPKKYWDVANMSIIHAIGKLSMQMY